MKSLCEILNVTPHKNNESYNLDLAKKLKSCFQTENGKY